MSTSIVKTVPPSRSSDHRKTTQVNTMNTEAVQRIDSRLKEIVLTVPVVLLYEFDENTTEWVSLEISVIMTMWHTGFCDVMGGVSEFMLVKSSFCCDKKRCLFNNVTIHPLWMTASSPLDTLSGFAIYVDMTMLSLRHQSCLLQPSGHTI